MARQLLHSLFALAALSSVQAYFLVGTRNILVSERLDPIINPGTVSGHVHSVVGGSNFGMTLSTASLRNSECTSMPIQEDHSNYWYPHLYFQMGLSHLSMSGMSCKSAFAVIWRKLTVYSRSYYLYNDAENGQPNTVQAFPDDFRMISGDMTLRSYNASSYAQQAVTFLCLDFNGVSTKYNELPPVSCPSGIRAQINFPMCWDGKNLDSADHKSHVAFPSGGPDSGTCDDPNFPVTLPRIFIEGYWDTGDFDSIRDTDAMNSTQPYVFSHGDPTGYGYHADFYNGWKSGVLQNVLDKCACTSAGFGDASCCSDLGVFTLETSGTCSLTPIVDEQVLGTVDKLPGNNPVRSGPQAAPALAASSTPAILSPAYAYTGASATATGTIASPAVSGAGSSASATVTSASATGSASGSGQSASGSSISVTASATSGNAGATAAPGSASASGSASNVGSSASSSGTSIVVVTSASSSGTGNAGATSIPAPAYGYSSSNAASASSGSPTTNVQAVIPTATASGAASTSSGDDDDDDDDCTDTDDSTSTTADVQAVVPTASATDTSDSTSTVSPASVATPTQASEADVTSTDSAANVATPTSEADATSTDSAANVATPTQTSEADATSTDSSANVATPTQASDTETETATSTDSSDSASASAASPSAASPASTSSSSTGYGSGSSSGWGDDDDDEYEFYCVRRKKKHSYGKRALPKGRRNHNSYRRLTLDDF
ncbi:hypothetical protein GYMLUDRAFT_246478 [Collybiopsis luxurians FD-317 M1]|uniref:DUF1996 domain-containing protein n=1 Tax=Collybiopsis luxurians FD-317 M1 TaxID=944289 RepID=A0A0D0B4B2_9AGAR|nr:hypothetical protein GYMLUDRAFT_246478 [Collybiopsis luxurians FD-317 M1]